jgi:hypothetical protein
MAGLPAVGISGAPRSLQAFGEPLAGRPVRETIEADQDSAAAEGDQPHAPGLPLMQGFGLALGPDLSVSLAPATVSIREMRCQAKGI